MAKIELCETDVELVWKGWSGSGECGKVFYAFAMLPACALGLTESIDFWQPDSHNWRCDGQN